MRRRDVLGAALAAPAFVPHARSADRPRFALGVASGQPRPDSVVLWTRLAGADLPEQVTVQWELAHDERFERIAARGAETALADWAHSVHAEPAGLDPARRYWYRFAALGQRSPTGRTRTAPAPDAPTPLRMVLASCQRWDHGHYAAWREAVRRDPDLVCFVGDYIYEYPSLPLALRRHDGGWLRTLDDYRARHAQYKSDPALQAAHAACPWLVVWDDHEVANDYAGAHERSPLGFDLPALRTAAYRAYWEHMPLSQAQRPVGPALPLFARLDWGRLARIHLLDERQYRDVQACPPPLRSSGGRGIAATACAALRDPARSLLGAAQERWLAEGWDLQRPWNLVAQQTLLAPRPRGTDARVHTDGWDGYPLARQRLLGTAAERRVPGLVVLGGDLHAHVVAELRADFDDPRAPVIGSEFCGTSISSQGRPQAEADAALARNPHLLLMRNDRRGCVVLDVDPRELRARLLAVRDPRDPGSAVDELARFVVEADRPGPQRI